MVLSSREGSLAPVYVSFFAGIVSASLAWYWAAGAGGNSATSNNLDYENYVVENGDNDDDDDHDDDSAIKQQRQKSYIRWVSMNDIKLSMEDIKNRIGELPRRSRKHWPWDQPKNRSRSSSPVGRREEQQQQEKKEGGEQQKPPNPHESKSEFCIGSIFGLDVGGTLAKLVYFEQKPEEIDSEFPHPTFRERFYRNRASALAVSLARRGMTTIEDDESENSISPPRLRAESAADERLFKSSPHLASAGGGSPSNHHHKMRKHSADSSADLRNLNSMRQESVPDDLNFYAEAVHLSERGGFHTTESMEDMLSAAAAAEKFQQRNNVRGRNSGSIRKSRSMFDFTAGRIEALDRFYTFAHRLDSYREGVKDHELSFFSRALGGDFHFIRFETRRMQNAMDLIRANNLHLNIREMGATGGGAHKYAPAWAEELGIEMKKQDELDSLVAGMQFVLSTAIGECYTFRPNDNSFSRESSMSDYDVGAPIDEDDSFDFDNPEGTSTKSTDDRGKGDDWWWSRKVQRDSVSYSETYPYMLVTIGTGVSILRVDGPRKHERVSGSTIGGGTYWGLIRLLTNVEDFEDAMRLAERGDASKVDMMVGDIYGEKNTVLEKIGLSPDVVASSFGKLVSKDDPASDLKEEDLARALLLMVTINIGQVAYLNAKMHKTSRIYFVGNFLRFNKISQRRLSFSIDYWSKGEMEALYLEHEGYFGALGAFLLNQDIKPNTPELRLKTQKSMPVSVTSEDGSNHSRSSSDHGPHRLLSQKSMPISTTTNNNKLYPPIDRRDSN